LTIVDWLFLLESGVIGGEIYGGNIFSAFGGGGTVSYILGGITITTLLNRGASFKD
jgi:hypothetical protein